MDKPEFLYRIEMGKCIYCSEPAGFLRRSHKACRLKFRKGKLTYVNEIRESIVESGDFKELELRLEQVRASSFLDKKVHNLLAVKAFDLAVGDFLEDGVLSQAEEKRLVQFKDYFELNQDVLDKNGSYTKVGMSAILRDLAEGKVPEQRINIYDNLPFLFQKSESLIWVFPNIEFYEQRTRTEYRGASHGVSIRVVKGVYYRTSSFKGRPVKINEMKYVGTGLFALTTKHVYFGSSEKKFKIPLKKLISVEPYEDGIGLQKDGVSTKPQVFKNLDGWFTHNAISNLYQR